MSFFGSLGNSISNPFKQFEHSAVQIATHPTKANFGDFISLFPEGGAIIVSDFKHPRDIFGQVAIAGTIYAGVTLGPALFGGSAAGAPAAGAAPAGHAAGFLHTLETTLGIGVTQSAIKRLSPAQGGADLAPDTTAPNDASPGFFQGIENLFYEMIAGIEAIFGRK